MTDIRLINKGQANTSSTRKVQSRRITVPRRSAVFANTNDPVEKQSDTKPPDKTD